MASPLFPPLRWSLIAIVLVRITACSNDESRFSQTKSDPVAATPTPTPTISADPSHYGTDTATDSFASKGSTPPRNAARRGNFTAWLERVESGYVVVIQIALQGAKNYRVGDLSGQVIGTDGYRQAIGLHDDSLDAFHAYDGGAELRMFVPGGAPSVHDTIDVSSSTLHEHEELDITF